MGAIRIHTGASFHGTIPDTIRSQLLLIRWVKAKTAVDLHSVRSCIDRQCRILTLIQKPLQQSPANAPAMIDRVYKE